MRLKKLCGRHVLCAPPVCANADLAEEKSEKAHKIFRNIRLYHAVACIEVTWLSFALSAWATRLRFEICRTVASNGIKPSCQEDVILSYSLRPRTQFKVGPPTNRKFLALLCQG